MKLVNLNRSPIEDFLISREWHLWYNDNYWVNPKCVNCHKSQDYTDHGMSMWKALEYEEPLFRLALPMFHSSLYKLISK